MSWWDFGEWSGYQGKNLALFRIACAFCNEEGNFDLAERLQKTSESKRKTLNYDIYACRGCGNLTMVFWSAASGHGGDNHDFKTLPWSKRTTRYPEHWPPDIGRHWLQARRSLEGENWDAAALMARSAVQLVARYQDAGGKTLQAQIDDLADRGILPPIMREWSHEVRVLGNDNAHPAPGAEGTDRKDAVDVVEFLRELLMLTYDLPHSIEEYRARRK